MKLWHTLMPIQHNVVDIAVAVQTRVICLSGQRAFVPLVAVQQSSRRLCHGPMCGGAHGSHRAHASSMADTILDHSRTIMTPLFLAYTSGKIRDYQPLPDAHTSAIRSSDSRYLVVRHPLLEACS